jgi:hypothetical protein
MNGKKITTGTWLPVFPGFYETIFNGEMIYENEEDYIRETIKPVELAECMIEKDYIVWKRNGFYKLYKDGRIQKPDGYISDGKSWEFIGFREKKPFGRLGKLIPREQVFMMNEKDFYYKNGKARYCVVDIDHSTTRIWIS